jgi:pectate lyase
MTKKVQVKILFLLLLQVVTIQFLTGQPIGYASLDGWGQNGTTGGEGGTVVTVSSSSEFLDYISREGPYIVQVDGMINVPSGMHEVTSDKTVIGLGSNSGINGGGLNIGLPISNSILELPPNAVHNVIICNMNFKGAGDDCINVMMFSHHIWIHHNTFYDSGDGALDFKRGSSFGTISYNRFNRTHKSMLLGHSDSNDDQDIGRLKVTYHNNWFDNGGSRHPRCRYGETHIFNNFYDHVGYGIGRGKKARIYSENNYVEGGRFTNNNSNSDSSAMIDFGSTGSGHNLNPELITWDPKDRYEYTLIPTSDVKEIVMANAGVGKMKPTPKPSSKGDANQDDVVDIVDALVVAQVYVGLVVEPFDAVAADVNCNNEVDIIDALLIAQYYVNIIDQFPC